MPDVSRKSGFLKGSELEEGQIVKIVSAGEWIKKDFSKERDGSDTKTVFDIKIQVDGEEKNLTLNATSRMSLADKWGPMTEDWINKQATVTKPMMPCFGEIKKVLCLVPMKEHVSPSDTPEPSKEEPWDE